MKDRFALPAYDQLGRGGRIAVQKGLAYRTVETPGMQLLIDTAQKQHASLADNRDYALLAEGLSQLGAFTAFLSSEGQSYESIYGPDATNYDPETLKRLKAQQELEKAAAAPTVQSLCSGAGQGRERSVCCPGNGA